MKKHLVKKFETLCSHYLAWFQERAKQEAAPAEREEFPRFQTFHEDVFENDRIVLNRMYYVVPLSPSDSRTGKLELFSFSELNLMEKKGEDIVDLHTVEYRIE